MRGKAKIAVIIPALNEEKGVPRVISALPDWIDDCIVVDNGSVDQTAAAAREAGARVILEPFPGYGAACLAGMRVLHKTDIVVFLDGDFSDYPEEMDRLVDPIIESEADFVVGSRLLGRRRSDAVPPLARFGNALACRLMKWFWKAQYTDLGPFRAISFAALKNLRMAGRGHGWTVEMQIRALQKGLRVKEVPVSYRRRIGTSKISGTWRGAIRAGREILTTIFTFALGDLKMTR